MLVRWRVLPCTRGGFLVLRVRVQRPDLGCGPQPGLTPQARVQIRARLGVLLRASGLKGPGTRAQMVSPPPRAGCPLDEVEPRGRHPRPQDPLGPQVILGNSQAAERRAELVERKPRIEQGAENHVARGAVETIEIQQLHAHVSGRRRDHKRQILPDQPRSPLPFQRGHRSRPVMTPPLTAGPSAAAHRPSPAARPPVARCPPRHPPEAKPGRAHSATCECRRGHSWRFSRKLK